MRALVIVMFLILIPSAMALTAENLALEAERVIGLNEHLGEVDRSQFPKELGTHDEKQVLERYIPEHGIVLAYKGIATARECVTQGQPVFLKGRYVACTPWIRHRFDDTPVMTWTIDELDHFLMGMPMSAIMLVLIALLLFVFASLSSMANRYR